MTEASEVDHLIPVSKGGSDDDSNLASTCSTCHEAKTLRDEGRKAPTPIGLDGYPVGWKG